MTLRAAILSLLSLFCLVGAPSGALAQIDDAQFKRDLTVIAQWSSRVIGSPGYYEAGKYLETEIGKLQHIELRKHEFAVMTPVTRSATIELDGGRIEPIYPFWPAHVRVCATPVEGIRGKLVYVGDCRADQLKPASLFGQIAVIDASARGRWSEAFYLGAKAVLVLGAADTTWPDLKDHELRIPVNLPRFYIPPGTLADDLRAGRVTEATLKASVEWQRKIAANYYALVRPAKANPAAPPGALMFTAPYDSSSLVPDLAPGAGQAVQTAGALALLRDLSNHPLDRPVVVYFSGGDSIQFLASRNMFLALSSPASTWNDELAELTEKLAKANHDLSRAKELKGSPERLSPVDDRDLVQRVIDIVDTDIAREQDQLFRLRSAPPNEQTNENRSERARLEDHRAALNRLKFAFTQQQAKLSDPENKAEAGTVMDRVAARLGGGADGDGLIQNYQSRKAELQARIDLHRWLAEAETGKPDAGHRVIELLVGLDLSDHGSQVGPMFQGNFQRASSLSQIQLYNDWFTKLQRSFTDHAPGTEWWEKIRGVVDLDTLTQTRAPITYLAGPMAIPSEMGLVWGTPALSMITLDDMRLRRDTATDTLANLNLDPILPQLHGVRELFWHAWNDPKFKGPSQLKRLDVTFTGQVVSAAPGKPVPDLPRPGFLVAYSYISIFGGTHKIPHLGILPWTLGVRRDEVRDCDAEGNYRFEGMPKVRSDRLEGPSRDQTDMQLFAVHVYRMDPQTGAITATTDLGKQAGDAPWSIDIKLDVPPLRSLAFNCEEFSLTGLYDPRYLQTLSEMALIDARRDAEPQRYCMWLDNKMLAGFVEPGTRNALLIRFGSVGNRLILINMPGEGAAPDAKGAIVNTDPDEGRGYTANQLNNIGPLALATSHDFFRLNDRRLKNYRRAGVSSSLIDGLHDSAEKQLAAAEQSLKKDDGVGLTRESTGAWANEARVYDAAQDMARDVVRAAIFLLMLCVPFSFCMERLLVATPNVYKQIAGIAGIFLVMTLALWTFHPAFKISASPLIIVLAFAIISMSLVVIFVIYGKFDTELKRLRSGRGTSQGASFASAGVLMSAVLLGIANMRKRKFRTVLTSVTIVLITFAVLWFTSTTHYRGTTTLPTGVASSHSGVMLRQRGFRPMTDLVAEQLRTVLADPALNIGKPTVVERWWAVSASDPKEQYDLVVPAKAGQPPHVTSVPAVLGLSSGESKLTRIAEVIGAEKFARLENGEKNVAYISSIVADELKAKEGDHVRLGGFDLEIAGIFNAAEFDQKVVMLSAEALAPLKYMTGELDAGGRQMNETTSESLDLGGSASAAEAGSIYEHLPASQMVIVPKDLCRTLNNSSLRCVGFRLENQKQVEAASEELTRRFALAMYAGYDDGVRMVAAGNLSSVSGASQVAVPLMIAGLIIFNTMMGSIAERRREIHVYTSLGLAPMHVGALFLAEAMTYGLVGTVFGYIIGQGLGTAMLKLGWLGSITLNYSGSSAMLTMGMILLIVLVSALVPARLASKIAAPSIDRTWKVPEPVDEEISAILPFTINRTAADGALAYLAEYFESHREGTIGKFSASKIDVLPMHDAESGITSRALKTTVWLTPYDLGVRQQVTLMIHPGHAGDIYEVKVVLHRMSGDDGSWYRMNRTFLTELRKQFLQWRSLTPARMSEYVKQSKQMFEPLAAVVAT